MILEYKLGIFFERFDIRRPPHNLRLHHMVFHQQLDAFHFAQHFTLADSVKIANIPVNSIEIELTIQLFTYSFRPEATPESTGSSSAVENSPGPFLGLPNY